VAIRTAFIEFGPKKRFG